MVSNPSFDPAAFFSQWDDKLFVPSPENGASFKDCIIKAFNLPSDDSFVYQAHGVTTLELTQKAINGKRAHGLHGWYHDEEGKPVCRLLILMNIILLAALPHTPRIFEEKSASKPTHHL